MELKIFKFKGPSKVGPLIVMAIAVTAVAMALLVVEYFSLYQKIYAAFGDGNIETDAITTIEELYQSQIVLARTNLNLTQYSAGKISADELGNFLDSADSIFSHFEEGRPIFKYLSGKAPAFTESQLAVFLFLHDARKFQEGKIKWEQLQEEFDDASVKWSLLTTDAVRIANMSELRDVGSRSIQIIGVLFGLLLIVFIVAIVAGFKFFNEKSNQYKKLSLLVASIGHDVRTPLQSILNAGNILSKQVSDEEKDKYSSIIQTSSVTLSRLIDDILTVVRREQMTLYKRPTHLGTWFNKFCDVYKAKCEAKGLKWEMHADLDGVSFIQVDPDRLTQCIGNLVDNAIKYTNVGGVEISINAHALGEEIGMLTLTVTDSGVGITEKDQQIIFNPFERARAGSDSHGMGLGLSIAETFIKNMQGQISVSSQVNKGSVFTVKIPIERVLPGDDEPIEIAPIVFSETSESGSKSDILIVEDDPNILETTDIILRNNGYSTKMAQSAYKALKWLESNKCAMVITDIQMSGMSGVELARELRKSNLDVKIIAMSAGVSRRLMEPDSDFFDALLDKPFEEVVLLKTIGSLGVKAV